VKKPTLVSTDGGGRATQGAVAERVDDMDSSLTLAQYKMHRQFLNGVMRSPT